MGLSKSFLYGFCIAFSSGFRVVGLGFREVPGRFTSGFGFSRAVGRLAFVRMRHEATSFQFQNMRDPLCNADYSDPVYQTRTLPSFRGESSKMACKHQSQTPVCLGPGVSLLFAVA